MRPRIRGDRRCDHVWQAIQRALKVRQVSCLLPGSGKTGGHIVGLFIPPEFIPAAGLERPDPARADSPADVSKRCLDPLVWNAVNPRKLVSCQFALHNSIDEG